MYAEGVVWPPLKAFMYANAPEHLIDDIYCMSMTRASARRTIVCSIPMESCAVQR